MARIGNIPVSLPSGVTVTLKDHTVRVKGPKGELSWTYPPPIRVSEKAGESTLEVSRDNNEKETKAMHGLTRALIANMVKGVSEGFQKRLLIFGTGYSCKVEGTSLLLNVGYMGRGHGQKAQFEVPIPDGLTVTVETPAARGETDPAKFVVAGCDKQLVGQFCAEVRKIRPPEPYKGKGIRYDDEVVRRKQGKAFAGGGG